MNILIYRSQSFTMWYKHQNWHLDSLGTTYSKNPVSRVSVSNVKFKMTAIFFKMATIPGNHSCFYYIACRAWPNYTDFGQKLYIFVVYIFTKHKKNTFFCYILVIYYEFYWFFILFYFFVFKKNVFNFVNLPLSYRVRSNFE